MVKQAKINRRGRGNRGGSEEENQVWDDVDRTGAVVSASANGKGGVMLS